MSVTEKPVVKRTDPSQSEGLWHFYRIPPPAPVGSIAYCGHRKQFPTPRPWVPSDPVCLVCADLVGWIR